MKPVAKKTLDQETFQPPIPFAELMRAVMQIKPAKTKKRGRPRKRKP